MNLAVYGMDVGFYSHVGSYPLETRCAMLADLGFDATNLTLWSESAWSDLPLLPAAAERAGLTVASIYLTVDLALPLEHPETRRALNLISEIGVMPLELNFRYSDDRYANSDPAGDGPALAFLEEALRRVEVSGGELRLYPHFAFWFERVDDALRLIAALDHPRLGIAFAAFHVYALEGADFFRAFQRAAPLIRGVNTNGSRRLSGQYFPVTIEPVDGGDFDNFAFLGALRSVGYTGTLGIQAYGIGGDAYAAFRRSLAALKDIERRLDLHPEWAALSTETL